MIATASPQIILSTFESVAAGTMFSNTQAVFAYSVPGIVAGVNEIIMSVLL